MVATWKKQEVDELSKKLKKSRVVGIVGIEGIPSKQFQKMRKSLGDEVEIKVCRNNVIRHALKKSKVAEELGEHLTGPSGIIFTDLSPFKLERNLSKNKTMAPAKAGTLAPTDIVIPKGDTPFAPGPIIGELQGVGIKAKIEGGKIIVIADSPVVSAGEEISTNLASVLARFEIEPIEIGLNLQAAIEDGVVYTGDVLHIDDAETQAKISSAYQSALNLSMYAGILNSTTIPLMVKDAHMKVVNLAFNADIITKETLEAMFGKAGSQAKALSLRIPDAPKEPVSESKPGEEPEKEESEAKPPEVKEEAPEVKEEAPDVKEDKKPSDVPAPEEKAKEAEETNPQETPEEKSSTNEKPKDEPAKPEEKTETEEKTSDDQTNQEKSSEEKPTA